MMKRRRTAGVALITVMLPRSLPAVFIVLCGFLALMGGSSLRAQGAVVRAASRVEMPTPVDSNSPAFWRGGRLFWFGSHGRPVLSEGSNQFGPWETREVDLQTTNAFPHWLESVWPEENGVLWGWYHGEPVNLIPDSTLTAPKIGAVISTDGGGTLIDLGIVLESGDPLDPAAGNGYFAGGHGDFSVILDRDRTYFYFLFDNYGGPASSQGVCIARMAYADRFNPVGMVWKYHNGGWQEPGRGGRVTPIFPVKKRWQATNPDALWGPSVHWNTHLNCFVMLLNRALGAAGDPGWSQEGIYISYSTDLTRPDSWTEPRKILDHSQFSGWYFFYPQVMGLDPGGTDRRAGQTARLYVNGISKWEIDFVAPPGPPGLELSSEQAATTIRAGEAFTVAVTAFGNAPFSYQWLKDGVALPQATTASIQIPVTTVADGGVYSVLVSNAFGTTASRGVTLTVSAPVLEIPIVIIPPARPEAFLSNLSVRSYLPSAGAVLNVGFVIQSDGPKPLVLRAIGPTLSLFGVPDAVADPRLEVFDGGSVQTAENGDWRAGDAEQFARLGAFALPPGSADAALVVDLPPGPGTAHAWATGGGVVLVEIYDPAAATRSKIVNLSARALVGPGEQLMIGGFSVSGTGSKRLLIRAMGPQLGAFGVENPLADPELVLHGSGGAQLAANDNWHPEIAWSFDAAGAAALPAGSRDAAVVVTLTAGDTYTVIVRSANGATGEALLEIYELPPE